MAALFYLKPKVIAITKGYHGVHQVIKRFQSVAELVSDI